MQTGTKIVTTLLTIVIALELLSGFGSSISVALSGIGNQSATYGTIVTTLFSAGGVLMLIVVVGVFYSLYKSAWGSK